METNDVLKELKKRVDKAGTLFEAAKELQISPSYLSDILNKNRPLSDNILSKLGFERVTTIRRTK